MTRDICISCLNSPTYQYLWKRPLLLNPRKCSFSAFDCQLYSVTICCILRYLLFVFDFIPFTFITWKCLTLFSRFSKFGRKLENLKYLRVPENYSSFPADRPLQLQSQNNWTCDYTVAVVNHQPVSNYSGN